VAKLYKCPECGEILVNWKECPKCITGQNEDGKDIHVEGEPYYKLLVK
jgi:hypothetical protein